MGLCPLYALRGWIVKPFINLSSHPTSSRLSSSPVSVSFRTIISSSNCIVILNCQPQQAQSGLKIYSLSKHALHSCNKTMPPNTFRMRRFVIF